MTEARNGLARAGPEPRGRWLALGLAAGVWLAGCGDDDPTGPAAVPVTVYEVVADPAWGETTYSANVQPYTQVDLAFQAGGTIAEITRVPGVGGELRDVQAGDLVRRGDLLAEVEDDTYRDDVTEAQQQLAAAQASFTKASEDFSRSRELRAKEFVSASDFDAARESYQATRAQMLQSEAGLEKAQKELSYCRLTSPMDGVVIQRQIEVGDLVAVGSVGFQVADVSRMKLEFAVPAQLALLMSTGDALAVGIDAIPGADLHGRVSRIDAAADEKTRAFGVEVTLANPEGRLRSGMVATLRVPDGLADRASTLVPLGSVVRAPEDPEGYAVFVVGGEEGSEQAALRVVELGEVFGDRIAVLAGLESGDSVVVRGARIVRDAQPVRVLP